MAYTFLDVYGAMAISCCGGLIAQVNIRASVLAVAYFFAILAGRSVHLFVLLF